MMVVCAGCGAPTTVGAEHRCSAWRSIVKATFINEDAPNEHCVIIDGEKYYTVHESRWPVDQRGIRLPVRFNRQVRLGDRVALTKPHFVERTAVPSGSTGTVVEAEWNVVRVEMDEHYEILNEWGNCIVFGPTEVHPIQVDVAVLGEYLKRTNDDEEVDGG